MWKFCRSVPAITVITLCFVTSGCEKNAPDRAAGEAVTLEQVPAPVKSTIERELQGGSVEKIQRRTKDGKSLYTVSVAMNGQVQRLLVADDGRLIVSRPAGDEDEEDD
ncbi:hypothetical protein [Burkholderia sp. Ac-20353]|uniref:hypothetical protein n=1 Tax=Burkholderia sp. Ac-20353 TaxID=2703894 RepID=UPI00197C61A2|nr:hypothetical protein [Burkholderia sp. Ac-20353]MBN3786882.1 hypothetical protein [Burkholderia sp. Ac-20353]